MPGWVTDQPFAIAYLLLFCIVFARAQATYWVGRGAHAGGRHTRLARHLDGERMDRATEVVTRWGWPVITVSFLTVGFQTFANAAAGLVRMPWSRYTLAMVPGCLAWAAIYATVGFAAFTAWLGLSARSSWAAWLVLALAVGVVVTALVWWRRRQRDRRRRSPSTAPVETGRSR